MLFVESSLFLKSKSWISMRRLYSSCGVSKTKSSAIGLSWWGAPNPMTMMVFFTTGESFVFVNFSV